MRGESGSTGGKTFGALALSAVTCATDAACAAAAGTSAARITAAARNTRRTCFDTTCVRLARALLMAMMVCGLAAPAAEADGALLIPREPPPNGRPAGYTVDAARAVRIASGT